MGTFKVGVEYRRLSVVGVSRYTRWYLKNQNTGFFHATIFNIDAVIGSIHD